MDATLEMGCSNHTSGRKPTCKDFSYGKSLQMIFWFFFYFGNNDNDDDEFYDVAETSVSSKSLHY